MWKREAVPEAALQKFIKDVQDAEQRGELAGLFERGSPVARQNIQSAPDRASKRSLLDSFRTGMKLYKSTFMKIYGYELTWPGFAEDALTRLEILGCSRAREYYTCIVAQYEHKHEKEMINVAEWYRKELERSEEPRARQQETEPQKNKLQLLKKNDELIEQQLQLLKQKQREESTEQILKTAR